MKYVLATTALIDHVEQVVKINGVPFPFLMEVGGPTVETPDSLEFVVVNIPVLIDGTVTIHTSNETPTYGSTRIIDSQFGDVAHYARRLVREGYLEAFPWLDLPAGVTA